MLCENLYVLEFLIFWVCFVLNFGFFDSLYVSFVSFCWIKNQDSDLWLWMYAVNVMDFLSVGFVLL